MTIEMELVGVRIQVPTNAPIMLLRERAEPNRVVPIYIGGPEAHAIDLAISEVETERPMTHDLFVETIDQLGATPEQVDRVLFDFGLLFLLSQFKVQAVGLLLPIPDRHEEAVPRLGVTGCQPAGEIQGRRGLIFQLAPPVFDRDGQ